MPNERGQYDNEGLSLRERAEERLQKRQITPSPPHPHQYGEYGDPTYEDRVREEQRRLRHTATGASEEPLGVIAVIPVTSLLGLLGWWRLRKEKVARELPKARVHRQQ